MAEVIIPVGFGSAAIRMLDAAEGKIVSFTFGYKLVPGSTAFDHAALIRDALTEPGSLLIPVNYGAGSYFQSVYVLEHVAGGFRSAELVVQILGTRSGGVMAPPQVSIGLKKKTEFVGKTQRGRMYLPAVFILYNDYTEAGRVATARFTTLTNSAAVLLGELADRGVNMQLLHTSPDDPPSEVLLLEVAQILRTQRRRLLRS